MKRVILSYPILFFIKKIEKRKHFSAQHHSRRKTDWEQFFRFVSFHPFLSVPSPFRFRSNTNTKKDQSGTPFAFLEKKKKIPPLVRRVEHQIMQSFVFLLSSVLSFFVLIPFLSVDLCI